MRHGRNATTAARTGHALIGALLLTATAIGVVTAQSPSGAASPTLLPSPAPDALRVVATTTVLADIVRNVGREHADVRSIVPAGVGPEDYEPTPADAMLLADADLIVSNGAGLDDFLDDLLASGTGGQTSRLVLGEGIPVMTVDGAQNPHFWLDPTLVSQYYVPATIAALGAIDPARADDYGANGMAYATRIEELDAQLQQLVATVPEANRKLVTFHDAFPYLARHFGFELVGVILENAGAEPTARELADLVERVKATGVRAVFSEAQFDPGLARTLAEEAGISDVITNLYTDALGEPPADTYLGMMRTDIERIAAALR